MVAKATAPVSYTHLDVYKRQVLSFALLFVGYMMSSITGLISQTGNLLTKILNAYNFTDRLDAMVEGTLNLKSEV